VHSPLRSYIRVLAALWAEEMGLSADCLSSASFVQLGGDARTAVNVSLGIAQIFGVDISASRLMSADCTIEVLCDIIDSERHDQPGQSTPAITPTCLSYGQQRFWALHELLPSNPFANVPYAFWISGQVDAACLSAAVGDLARRHSLLRMRLTAEDVPRQFCPEDSSIPFETLKTADAGQQWTKTSALEYAQHFARIPFDLVRGPVARAALIMVSSSEALFIMAFHHIIVDGWSLGVITRDLSEFYSARRDGRPTELDEIRSSYQDFAAWERSRIDGLDLATDLAWWRTRLQGAPRSMRLRAGPDQASASFAGSAIPFSIADHTARQLRSLARAKGATLFMSLLAGCHAFLSLISGSTDILVGTPVARRHRPWTRNVVGYFSNTVVMRGDCSGDPTFNILIDRARDWAVEAYAHQDVPFQLLVRELVGDRQLNRNPFSQVLVQLELEEDVLALPGTVARRIEHLEGGVRADLEFHFYDGADISGQLVCSVDLFDPESADEFLTKFLRFLQTLADAPDTVFSDLQL
jgi:hypothetical protein